MTQPSPYGLDLGVFWSATGPDADSGFTEVHGLQVLAQSLMCRLTTPRGSVAGCPNDCMDIRDFLGAGISQADAQTIQSSILAEINRDARVMPQSTVRVQYNTADKSLTISLRVVCAQGPFTMTLAVSKVSVQLLNVSAN